MKKILVIEDDVNIRESLVELLEMKSFNLLSADNGTEGLKLAQEQIPDLILCDVMMPGMNGYEVVEAIRKDSRFLNIPFIFLSAKAMDTDRTRQKTWCKLISHQAIPCSGVIFCNRRSAKK